MIKGRKIQNGVITLMVLGLVFGGLTGQASAASCQIDGSGVIAGLPEELAELLGNNENRGNQGKVCVAPTAKPKKVVKPRAVKTISPYKGPIVAVQGAHIANEVVVSIRGGQDALDRVTQDYGLEVRSAKFMAVLGGLIVRFSIPDGRPVALVRAALSQDPLIIQAVPNHIYELNEGGSSLKSSSIKQYSLKASGILKAHKLAMGRGVKVAIIDSGVDLSHPGLVGAIGGTFDGLPKVPIRSRKHGTAVSLLVGGAFGGFVGAAPEASLFVARAFDKSQSGKTINSVYAVIEALNWAMEQDVDVINMSFSGPKNELLAASIKSLFKTNVVMVAAAGNGGPQAPFSYPAAIDGVFAVTATDAKNRIYSQANQGGYVFVAAPGVDLLVPFVGEGGIQKLAFKTGTSYGAALFSGICALVLERLEKPSLQVFAKLLLKSVKDLGKPGRDKVFGHGLVLAEDFVRRAGQ